MIKKLFSFSAAVVAASSAALGQHSDVEFTYDDVSNPTSIEVEQANVTTDGIQFFEAEFEEEDPLGDPGNFSSDAPGFTTEEEAGEGPLFVGEDDFVWLRFLDASAASSFGVGYVNFYDPVTEMLGASGRIAIEDNTGATDDLVLNGASIEPGSGPDLQFLGFGDGAGDVHGHVEFDLLDDATAPLGAYGVLLQIESDFDVADGNTDISSEPFWFIWNHGLSEDDFENKALAAFGVATIPEPTAALLISGAAVTMLTRRRRR